MSLDLERLKTIARRLDFMDWAVWFGVGLWTAFDFLAHGSPLSGFFAVLCLSCGALQLAAHRWAWHLILGAWTLCAAFIFFVNLDRGFTLWRAAGVACAIWGAINHYRDRPRFRAHAHTDAGDTDANGSDTEAGPKHSLVLWLREPLYLDASILGRIASRAFGLPFNDGEDCDCFVVGKQMHYVMRVQDAFFLVHHWERPYFDNPAEAAKDLRELRRATAARDHRAWFSVDFLRASADLPENKIHDAIGRMLAEVADNHADILAVFHPATGRIAPWEPALREKLAGGDPLSLFEDPGHVPVIRVSSDSPSMAAAVAEARRRWPEFVAAYHAAADKDHFSVKAPVTEAGRTEFIWINVKALAGDQIHGLLANEPLALGDLKLGSFVSVAVSDLNDWVCPDPADPDRPLGLFTVKAVSEAGRA